MEWVVLALLILCVVFLVMSYNKLVRLKNSFKNALSQIDIQLQRRYDLIPNLVETAKAYIKHERETLEAVIAARNTASAAAHELQGKPEGSAVRNLAVAEAALGGALSRFFAVVEDYPDLKANQNLLMLQEELGSTENRIAFARQAFNDAVMQYNIARESFPANLYAASFGFGFIDSWLLEDGEAKKVVKVNFA